jgi:hypothetical protein
MEKNTKTILIVGGVAAVGIVSYMLYKAFNPAAPTPIVKQTTTTTTPGVSFNINTALSTIGSWFGLGKQATPAAPTQTASFAGQSPLKAGMILHDGGSEIGGGWQKGSL